MKGMHLEMMHPFWDVSGKAEFPAVLESLPDVSPEECVCSFEGGSPRAEALEFLRARVVPERACIGYRIDWPKSAVFHLPATPETRRH